jgi:cystathionine beta-lyase/cystathionine gamma-synthase
MQRHNDNAMALATMLARHDHVDHVYYPGLSIHPQHELARSQMSGFSGLLSFAPSGGGERAEKILDTLRLVTRAASLGSVHSLASRPSAMWSSQPAYRDQRSPESNEALIRLSVGLESTADLLADFENALALTS